jgi:hypothetical protein
MTETEFPAIRTVLAFRLIGLMPTFIAAQTGIGITAVKRILRQHGSVPPRGPRAHHWIGPYSIVISRKNSCSKASDPGMPPGRAIAAPRSERWR